MVLSDAPLKNLFDSLPVGLAEEFAHAPAEVVPGEFVEDGVVILSLDGFGPAAFDGAESVVVVVFG